MNTENKLAVVGNGIIGHGVAEVFAKAGWSVTLIGRDGASLHRALAKIRASLDMFVSHELIGRTEADAALGRVAPSQRLDDAASATLVIEALPEDIELKRQTFRRLDEICASDAVLGTASGHPASSVGTSVTRKARVIATHFWYPPQLLPLVEVCGSPETSPEVVDRVMAWLRDAGKEPVLIEKEVPGFIGNRIQFAALREAWSLWSSGVASAAAIDAVVRNSIGRRLAVTGPLQTADVGGLDTFYHFACFLQPTLDNAALPPARVAEIVAAGDRGVPSGRGHYEWSGATGEDLRAARQAELIRWLKVDAAARRGGDER